MTPLIAAGNSVIVDLGGVTFLDASGVRVLAVARDPAEESGVSFRVLRPTGVVARVLAITGFDGLVEAGTPESTAI